MRIINSLKDKKALKWGIVAAISVAIVLPIIQTGFFQNSFESWFLTLVKSPLNTSLFIIFSLLFGASISLQVYNLSNKRICKDCNSKTNKKGFGFGAVGAVFGSLVGVCPACIGLVGLIFPLGTSLTLTYYGWVFMLIAIGIMTLSIYLLGGFKKE